jgi:hypothetical protein
LTLADNIGHLKKKYFPGFIAQMPAWRKPRKIEEPFN